MLKNRSSFLAEQESWDDIEKGVYAIVGSPETVRQKLDHYRKELGVGVVLTGCQTGTLPHELARKSMELLAREVLPHVRDLEKVKYGARVLLSRKGGEAETIDVCGRPTVILHGGDGPPFVYLHSTLGESIRWLPFLQAWSKQYTRLRRRCTPASARAAASTRSTRSRTWPFTTSSCSTRWDSTR